MRKSATPSQVAAELRGNYNALEEMLAQLTRAQRAQPRMVGEWSVKETLAHLAEWDARGIVWISDALRGEFPKIPAPNTTWTERHKLNAETQRASQRYSFERVLNDYRRTFDRLLELVESIDERDWERATPVQHKYGIGETVRISELVRWRLNHLTSHTKPIGEWLERRRGKIQNRNRRTKK